MTSFIFRLSSGFKNFIHCERNPMIMYLIVIDDVWTVRAWEAIQSKLPENNEGSRVIVTTRIETVASACSHDCASGHCIHKMQPLKLEDSKKLFLSNTLPLKGSMNHIVTLSYNHLPHELKGCMMYFSIFPEDYGANIQCMTCFLRSCLHGGQYKGMLYDKIRRLSIHADVESVDSEGKRNFEGRRGEDNLNIQHVRSLSMFQLHGKHKLLKKLGNFVLLRVLDLEDCKGVTNKHVRYACNLYQLRFLSLRGTKISKVPRQNLEHLQILDLEKTLLTGLPKTVTKLERIEYIRFSSKDDYWGLTYVLGINDSKVAQEVGELEQLEELVLSIYNKAIGEEVLKQLALSISIGSHGSSHDGGKILNFLHHQPTPPRLLRTLWIRGDIVDGLPRWIRSLTHLVSFTAATTTLIDDELFGVLCMLPNLKTLYVTWDCYRGDELVARTSHKFPMLRHLKLGGSMAMLEMLDLDFDHRSIYVAERSILGIEHLTNLKKVTLKCRGDYHAPINTVLEQLKAENDRPSRSTKFQISVKYL
ncbi:hypothetical protein BDA96_02G053600 [Sorghum bicolor]|uniref:NB-ARC domain-containing protein n=1 Tax=Sorghum bicolor TaxID=4558 RepID=A0A921RLZ3_SORBI|nr:hypothetical protein BDA96_02G053600 [Sorghum bicolor]